jgi:hypothetical protein
MARRSDLTNPIVESPENRELYRAFESLVDQLRRRDDRGGRSFTTPWYSASATGTLYPVPRVTADGYSLGRFSYVFTKDTTFSSTDYYTFTLYQHFTQGGVRLSRPVTNGAWGTNEVAPRAHIPYVVEVDLDMDPGDTVRLEITVTGVPVDAEFAVQVDEMFGPEE